ncbi:hypothetical protein ACIPF8_22945 [Collimonas sp. NPDC087041]|uniref:hypothetical protein n=1 Tax=Collimonas sp. NPDC087041 TaxID=3363960 RepID=UPI0037F989F5
MKRDKRKGNENMIGCIEAAVSEHSPEEIYALSEKSKTEKRRMIEDALEEARQRRVDLEYM